MSRSAARYRRSGTSTFDLLVSFTLLCTLFSVATPLIVRHGQTFRSHRNYRVALDELTNQLELLSALSPDELQTSMERLTLSSFVAERLPAAELKGELTPADFGTRITLMLGWNELGGPRAPVTMAAWTLAIVLPADVERSEP